MTNPMAYVAIHSCGKIVEAAVDDPDSRKETARRIARWVSGGDIVERHSVVDMRRAAWCKCYQEGAIEKPRAYKTISVVKGAIHD